MKFVISVLALGTLLIFTGSVSAQSDSLRDTTKVTVSPVKADTSSQRQFIRPDSLPGPHIKMTPLPELQKPVKKRPRRFSVFDSLASYFASPRLDQREMIDESWAHDAGDYFRFDPAFVVRDYQDTPMRKTVQPYGLTGDRLNTLLNDQAVHPFEHVFEPDGMVDMNDLPTAWDKSVFLLPGAAGMIFGGNNATATLFSRPTRPETIDPQSALLVDKGQLGFANKRGRFSKAFTDGRLMDMSIGYRTAGTGFIPANNDDDSYHYDGNVYWPTLDNQALNLTGHLYERQGKFYLQTDNWPSSLSGGSRHHFDRTAQVAYQIRNGDHPELWEFGYNYQRNGNSIDGFASTPTEYQARLNLTGHGLFARRDWQSTGILARAEFSADRLKYDDGRNDRYRNAAAAAITLARPGQKTKLASHLGLRSSESFGLMPQAALLAERESERFFVMASLGLAEREPSLHERYLRYQLTDLYPNYKYADSGNPALKLERQLTGSLLMEAGKIGNTIRLEITAGKIFNGIDWSHQIAAGVVTFSPVNEDITFATITGQKCLTFGPLLKLHGGASYHYVDYAGDRSRPYQPDYNAFGGAELHYYWKQKLINFWAYGEAVYVSAYDGYFESNLGNNVVFNAKLSFQMGNFRFHVLWQNPLSSEYAERDFYTHMGRVVSYGFTWNFFD